MINVTVYTLEDNKDYNVIDKLSYNNKIYVLLSEVGNIDNVCVRELMVEDGDYLRRLDTDYDIIYNALLKRNKK